MTDNVTDNEIIKDLETCFDIKGCAKCSHNDGLSHCVFCIRTLLKDALGLINRQKAEIESLKARNNELNALNKTASIEAVREFAESCEKAILPLLTSATLDKKDGIYACLDVLKEMVGGLDA